MSDHPTTLSSNAPTSTPAPFPVPATFAHFVLKTSQFDAICRWYQTVLGMHLVFGNEQLAFLTYDGEHHRLAVVNAPGLVQQPGNVTGLHHVSYTYAHLGDLVATYERLAGLGIQPVFCCNHGPTTSIYYADPDGNQIELQVENYDSVEESTRFFYTDAFKRNPIGVDFDPRELARRYHAGEDEHLLKMRPDSGARGLDSVPLR